METWTKNSGKTENRLTKAELFRLSRASEPSLNPHTFSWRLRELCKQNVLQPVARGQYSLQPKTTYLPRLDQSAWKLNAQIQTSFGGMMHSILQTNWLNDLSRHQAAANFTVVEIEKDAMEPLFHHLRHLGHNNVFLKPHAREMELYILGSSRPVVVMPMVSRSPLDELREGRRRMLVPALEKILVDLYCSERIFFYLGGEETKTIFRNATTRYALNYTTLLSYASRRGRRDEVFELLSEVVGKEFQDLFK